jgi:hypothetical protein
MGTLKFNLFFIIVFDKFYEAPTNWPGFLAIGVSKISSSEAYN